MIPQKYIDNQIRSYFRERKDDEISPYYETARKIVEKEKNIQKDILVSSRRVNHFFVLGFAPDAQKKEFALDRNSRQPDNVYVVDLSKEKVLAAGDFESAFELYKSIDLIHKASELSQDDINVISKITSAIALNTWDIMDDFIVGQKFPGDVGPAHIDVNDSHVVLTFFINRTEMRMMFLRCKLTCSETECSFTSESVL